MADSLTVTKPRGRPFPPGNNANPHGRPKKANSFRDLVIKHSVADKRAVIETAFREAIAGDHNWAMFLARVAGDLNPDVNQVNVNVAVLSRYVLGAEPE